MIKGIICAATILTGLALTQAGASAATPHRSAAVPRDIYQCQGFIQGDNGAEVYCSGTGTSQFRVAIKCTPSGNWYYGSWQSAGNGKVSAATCPVNQFIDWWTYQIQ